MVIRYRELIGLNENNCIYNSYAIDSCRKIVTRWRLSNFSLAIETWRYKRPKVERNRRYCQTCLVVEDEEHVLLNCRLYNRVRDKHSDLFNSTNNVKSLLNPKTTDALYKIAKVLFEIEKIHEKFTTQIHSYISSVCSSAHWKLILIWSFVTIYLYLYFLTEHLLVMTIIIIIE